VNVSLSKVFVDPLYKTRSAAFDGGAKRRTTCVRFRGGTIVTQVRSGSLPLECIGAWVEPSRASGALGRALRIGGGIELRCFPELPFEARDVTLANLSGRLSPHLVQIGVLELEIDLEGLDLRRLAAQVRETEPRLEGVELAVIGGGPIDPARARPPPETQP